MYFATPKIDNLREATKFFTSLQHIMMLIDGEGQIAVFQRRMRMEDTIERRNTTFTCQTDLTNVARMVNFWGILSPTRWGIKYFIRNGSRMGSKFKIAEREISAY